MESVPFYCFRFTSRFYFHLNQKIVSNLLSGEIEELTVFVISTTVVDKSLETELISVNLAYFQPLRPLSAS